MIVYYHYHNNHIQLLYLPLYIGVLIIIELTMYSHFSFGRLIILNYSGPILCLRRTLNQSTTAKSIACGFYTRQRHSNAIEMIQLQKKRKKWIWLDIESLCRFLCLQYSRSLNSKISVSAFHTDRDNVATMTQRRILLDDTLEIEHSRQINSILRVRKSPRASWRTNLTETRSVLCPIGISCICDTFSGRSTRAALYCIAHFLARRFGQAVSWY